MADQVRLPHLRINRSGLCPRSSFQEVPVSLLTRREPCGGRPSARGKQSRPGGSGDRAQVCTQGCEVAVPDHVATGHTSSRETQRRGLGARPRELETRDLSRAPHVSSCQGAEPRAQARGARRLAFLGRRRVPQRGGSEGGAWVATGLGTCTWGGGRATRAAHARGGKGTGTLPPLSPGPFSPRPA